jgi:hypothetical protein
MDAGVRQVTELLGGNRRSVGLHAGACFPSSSVCSESLVANREVFSREIRGAPRSIKSKSCGYATNYRYHNNVSHN